MTTLTTSLREEALDITQSTAKFKIMTDPAE